MFDTLKNPVLIRHGWPLVCGLVVGGLLGGLMHSVPLFFLFGGMAWLYFWALMREYVTHGSEEGLFNLGGDDRHFHEELVICDNSRDRSEGRYACPTYSYEIDNIWHRVDEN